MTKQTKWPVRLAMTQFSLGIHLVWPKSSLSAHWLAKDSRFLHADSEDSDQTGQNHFKEQSTIGLNVANDLDALLSLMQ